MKTASLFRHHPCSPSNALMNGAENFGMTGSGNPRVEHLSWFSEVASAVSKGRFVPNQNVQGSSISPHRNSSPSFLPNPGPVFSPPAAVTRNVDARMFAPTFQVERTRHMQPSVSVPVGGMGTTLYYSQAPRSQPYSNFFQATYSSPMAFAATASPPVTTSAVLPEGQRSYLQVDNFQQQIGMQSASSHSQLPAYLQQNPNIASSPSSIGHNRHGQQGRSILVNHLYEEAIEREPPTHVRIQLSPVVTQVLDDSSQRRSTDSHLNSPLTPPQELPRMSPGYRMPTGKEGSLKHRILRPPSIHIVDPPPSAVLDAPLSAPPIRSQREPSPKQARSIPDLGYRSFSSSASSLTDNRIASSPCMPNHHSSLSSGSSPSPAPPASPTTAQLKYPQSFMKGAIIQLANNQLKQVENMTTEDFIECGLLSSTLRIDSSTVTSIEKMPSTGAAKLCFHVGQDNIQITVEAPLEHPFFVYKQGWSSCSPDRSAQRYGLDCHKLKVGDTCISLTDKPRPTLNGGQKATNTSVPNSAALPEKGKGVSFNNTVEMEGSRTLCLPSNSCLPEKQSEQSIEKLIAAKSEETFTVGKRKRRWSAPDNVPPKDDGASL